MKTLKICMGFALSAVAMAASAHTIAIGSVNAGAPGSVTIWMGTYTHGTPFTQGSVTIGSQTVAFGNLQLSLPAGLVAGDNYFYASGTSTVGEYNSATNTTGLAAANWQSATLTGLSAGFNSYTISGMTSVNWADWNSGQSNWTGRIFIPGTSVGVPEPSALALVGLALVGVGLSRRKAA